VRCILDHIAGRRRVRYKEKYLYVFRIKALQVFKIPLKIISCMLGKSVHLELRELQSDVAELNSILNAATRQEVKEAVTNSIEQSP
jgi:hypothetical protein